MSANAMDKSRQAKQRWQALACKAEASTVQLPTQGPQQHEHQCMSKLPASCLCSSTR